MSDSKIQIKYEVIARGVVRDISAIERHALKLLYRGDGTPWWTCSAGMDLPIPADCAIQPGDFVTLTIERKA